MDKVARWFNSHEGADKADREYRQSLTPQQRLEILLQLIENHYGPSKGIERVYTIVELERG